MTENFAQMFEESLANQEMKAGSIITGTIVEVGRDFVVVNAGLKSEGVIPVAEFYNEGGEIEANVGDVIEVSLDAVEDGFGGTRLSREKAKRAKLWDQLETAMNANESINGIITGKVKGGFTVEVGDIRAFLPGSLVDIRPVRDLSHLEGKKLEFKVVKLDRRRNNVVVSRRAIVEQEGSAERDALLENLQEGQVIKGMVKNLTDYGAFIDLGGIDGLLHITDMAWKRVKQPSDIVNIGDEIDVKVLKFDKERNRVSLGLKQLGEDPWENLARRYPMNSRIFGKVTNIADYGCFVEIEDGVEGLVHVSEMDWTNKNVHPSKVVNMGDEVEVMILDIDEERRRISLGMKQCHSNPWEEFAGTHAKGDRISGVIKSITDFGIFVGLAGGIDGLLHLSDLSWTEEGEEAVHGFKKGDELDTVILGIDPERERISLGIKQIDRDPFDGFLSNYPKGSIVTGIVSEVDAKGAVVKLEDDVEGTIKASDLSRDRVEDARAVLSEGDEIEARIVGVDRKSHTVTLSVKAKDHYEEQQAVKDYTKSAGDAGSATTIGDLLKEQMDNN